MSSRSVARPYAAAGMSCALQAPSRWLRIVKVEGPKQEHDGGLFLRPYLQHRDSNVMHSSLNSPLELLSLLSQ